MVRSAGPFWVLAALLALGGCSGGGASARSATGKAPRGVPGAGVVVKPVRVLPLGERNAEAEHGLEPDGTQRRLTSGLRWLLRPDGSVERAREVFDTRQSVSALELPSHLGGGHLFYVAGSDSTQLWRAATWTGKLEAFASVDFQARAIVPGFDRIYVIERRRRAFFALDPQSGKAVDPGALPAAPDYGEMAFADGWLGAVEVPLQGVLVSFDAGASWHPIGVPPGAGIKAEHGELLIGDQVIDPGGSLRQRSEGGHGAAIFKGAAGTGASAAYLTAAEIEAAEQKAQAKRPPPTSSLGRQPLRVAVLHGWPDTAGTALVAAGGALGRVRLRDGKVLDTAERAYSSRGPCQGLELGASVGFVCGGEGEGTEVLAFEPPLGLRSVLDFEEPRQVSSSGNGALVIRGGCEARAESGGGRTRYCLRGRDGTLRRLNVTGDRGVERVVALADGRAVVLVPPRSGTAGSITEIAPDGSAKKPVKLQLPKRDAELLALLRHGLWLDGFVERKPGQLAGWVVAGGPFAGVRVKLNGQVRVGPLQPDVERTLLSGKRGLSFGESGGASQTTDGGFTWQDVELPADPNELFAAGQRSERRGCSPVGCAFGSWLRVGWLGKKDRDRFETPPTPAERAAAPPGGGRWLLSCTPTGENAGVARVVGGRSPPAARRAAGRRGQTPESTAWSGLEGKPPPRRGPRQVGFDLGTENLEVNVRGYAWGEAAADWLRAGRWQVYVSDPYSVRDGVWATEVTASPWASAEAAARSFGQESPASWSAALDPGGDAGVLTISDMGSHELFLLQRGRRVVQVRDATRWEITHASGVVELGSRWYLGQTLSSGFRLFRVEGEQIDLVHYYPGLGDDEGGSRLAYSVVRSDTGDALGIWVREIRLRGASTRWYVFPVDLRTGEADAPLVIDHQDLASLPRPCTEGDTGWLLEGAPPIDPYVDFPDSAGVREPRRLTARWLAGPGGVCVEALAARAGSDLSDAAPRSGGSPGSGRPTVLMSLSDRGRTGRRWGLRCGG